MVEALTSFVGTAILLLVCLAAFALSQPFPLLRRRGKVLFLLFLLQLFRESVAFLQVPLPGGVVKGVVFLFDLLLFLLILGIFKDSAISSLVKRGVRVSRFFWDLLSGALVLFFCLFLLKDLFGFNITPLLATSAIATVILGLAVQDILGNLLAGVVFHFEDSLRLGDWVQVDGRVGEVRDLTWRAVRIVNSSGEMLVVSNQEMVKGSFVNLTRLDRVRVLTVGASYDDPPPKVIRALKRAALSTQGIAWDPPPQVMIKEFADSAILYKVVFHLKEYKEHSLVEGAFNLAVWEVFDREGIVFPYPTRTLYVSRKVERETLDQSEEAGRVLREADLFSPLGEDERAALLPFASLTGYRSEEVIVCEGERGDSLFVVVEGNVGVFKGEKRVAGVGKGGVLGEIALFTGDLRNATLKAEGSVRLLRIPKEAFETILKRNRGFIETIEKMVNLRLAPAPGETESGEKRSEREHLLLRIRKYLLG